MPSLSTLTTFLLIVAVFAATPGPSNLYVIAQGLRAGRRAGLAAAVGCALAAATYVAATILGLAALLASSATALSVLHYLGGAYLIFLGIRAWRAGARADTDHQPIPWSSPEHRLGNSPSHWRRALGRGFLVELSNPKVALFFLAFFPQFVHHNAGPITAQLLVLGIVFCLIGLLSDSLYALASGAIRQRAGGNRRLLGRTERASAVLYLGLGSWAIWTGSHVEAT